MKLLTTVLVGIAFASLPSAPVLADTFTFSYDGFVNVPGSNVSGSGQFTAVPTGTANVYQITAISGTVDGMTIAHILPPGSYADGPVLANDNLLHSSGGSYSLDVDGVAFLLTNGQDFALFQTTDGSAYKEEFFAIFNGPGTSGPLGDWQITDISTSAVPEPESLGLFGTGTIGLLSLLRTRSRKSHV
jgi:hypothetical protein